MITRTVRVGTWEFDFFFAVGVFNPEELSDRLALFDAPEEIMERTANFMAAGDLNTGFTYSNTDLQRGVVWVGPQSEGRQWINTTVHEIVHVAIAIARDKGIDYVGEAFAYLLGDIVECLSDILCLLGCDSCRKQAEE